MASYVLIGNSYSAGTTSLTYSYATAAVRGVPFSAEISDASERAIIAGAFAYWTALTGIKFVQQPDGAVADIRLGYSNIAATNTTENVVGLTTLSYGADGITTPDSPYIQLQDPAELPLITGADGQVYYGSVGGATYEQLAIHEIGHVLGFGDNTDPNSVEDGSLTSSNTTFDATDLAGAQFLYPATAAAAIPPSYIPVQPTLFTQVDTSQSNATTAITADSYDGPLSFLSHGDAYSYNGYDNVQVSAGAATNPLIATGSGDDLLIGSATGSSVLDAGTGANIENDGGNGNTTFVQNGYVGGDTWDFLQNMHGSDEDIMFGYIAGFSKISVQANGGLASDTGATVTIDPGNGNTEKVTFVGVSAANLHGCSADVDGVPSWVLWTS
jgi:hypothetical protein